MNIYEEYLMVKEGSLLQDRIRNIRADNNKYEMRQARERDRRLAIARESILKAKQEKASKYKKNFVNTTKVMQKKRDKAQRRKMLGLF